MKGVKHMNEITTLTVRLPREDKETLMMYAEDHDLSASQIVRQLIRHYLFRCNMLENY
jgi:predicted DNA-binding protein